MILNDCEIGYFLCNRERERERDREIVRLTIDKKIVYQKSISLSSLKSEFPNIVNIPYLGTLVNWYNVRESYKLCRSTKRPKSSQVYSSRPIVKNVRPIYTIGAIVIFAESDVIG